MDARKKYALATVTVVIAILAVMFIYCNFFGAGNSPQSMSAVLSVNNPQTGYSASQSQLLIVSLTINGQEPYVVDYYINDRYFARAQNIVGEIITYGLNAGDSSWGFHQGQNTLYFIVSDAAGATATSNTITFNIVT